MYSIKSSILCQKARQNCLLKRERNTRLFPRSIARRRACNNIARVKVGDKLSTNPGEIKNIFFEYFRDFLTAATPDRIFALAIGSLPKIEQNLTY